MVDHSFSEEASMGAAGRRSSYEQSAASAKAWVTDNLARLNRLLNESWLRNYIFEPFKGLFENRGKTHQEKVFSVISIVALINMVLAGLPGKMGVGVAVSVGMELWMAWVIARCAGMQLTTDEVWKHLLTTAGAFLTALVLFKQVLGLAFSMGSIVPGVNPLILAELVTTDFIGLLLWLGFQKLYSKDYFSLGWSDLARASKEAWKLFKHQFDAVRSALSMDTLRTLGTRIKAFLTGDIVADLPRLRGELFTAACMGYLLQGQYSALEGPVGKEFIGAIRDRYPDLKSASIEEIAAQMHTYNDAQLVGVENLVKGKLFERMVVKYENDDGDVWTAVTHQDESWPGSDIVMFNADTGETLELSLKATMSPSYVESALTRYPDIPIIATSEVAGDLNDARVSAGPFSDRELTQVTQDNFEVLLNGLSRLDVASGVATTSALSLWPFVIAYMRRRINQDQFEQASVVLLGDAGKTLASRLAWAVALGPVFAWVLLARGTASAMVAVQSAGTTSSHHSRIKRVALSSSGYR